jgi:L,D-transpeptidase YcbB
MLAESCGRGQRYCAQLSAPLAKWLHDMWRRLCVLGLLCTYSCFVTAQSDIDPVASAIGAELDALMSPEVTRIHGAEIAMADHLRDFYSYRQFRPVWTSSEAQRQLFEIIADTYDDGLDPADYHLAPLRELSVQIGARDATAVLRARYDILLTDALLRMAYHFAFGKVDPETFDAQWNYGRTLPGAALPQALDEAIASTTIRERLTALRPTHHIYERMRRELARYRSIEKDGGWPAIPEGSAIKPGVRDPRVAALRAHMVRSGDLSDTASNDPLLYDEQLVSAVKHYQARTGLEPDGVVGPASLTELNVPLASRITQLRVNLDRGRVLLHDLPKRFLVVNIAGYTVYLVDGQRVVWSARAQVGKAYRRTPLFRSDISYIVFNPTWTVPPGIIAADILPAARKDPHAITRKGLRVLDSSGRVLDPAAIDWSQFRGGHIPYTLRQEPGPSNALGSVKFMFPNRYLVYLHDTPSQSLFERADRAFSSGCVRVERALELAELVLDDRNRWSREAIARTIDARQLRNVTLNAKLPVLLTYWTAWVDAQDTINFRRDIYGNDEAWARALDGPFKIRARPIFEHH